MGTRAEQGRRIDVLRRPHKPAITGKLALKIREAVSGLPLDTKFSNLIRAYDSSFLGVLPMELSEWRRITSGLGNRERSALTSIFNALSRADIKTIGQLQEEGLDSLENRVENIGKISAEFLRVVFDSSEQELLFSRGESIRNLFTKEGIHRLFSHRN